MPEEAPLTSHLVDEYVAALKLKVPVMEHGALDSRLEQLLNDAIADEHDVISILQQEFDPGESR